jgi:hypothetical protein
MLERALAELRHAMGATTLESFVVSLSNICWHGEKDEESVGLDEVNKLADLWTVSSHYLLVSRIG